MDRCLAVCGETSELRVGSAQTMTRHSAVKYLRDWSEV